VSFLKRSSIHCALAAIGLLAFSTAQAKNNDILQTKLSNGLEVIIQPDHRTPMVMSQIWYKVGSTDESGNTLGVSHALEHMMFKGTAKVPNDEFTRLSRVYGGSINAATFTNYTNYYQLYPKAYFPMALELEADRMQNLVLRQQDFDTEIKVVMEERRQRTEDNPRSLAFERFKWIAQPTSHYRQPVIGHMKTLENLTLSDLKQWYQTWYTPNNAILVVVGDIEPKQALQQIETYFGAIPAKALPQRNDVTEFDQLGYRYMQIKSDVQVPNLYMTWNVKSLSTAKNPQDAYALSVLRSILDSGISSRLQNRLVREQKLLTSVSTSYDLYSRGDSLFSITALPANGVSFEQAEQALQQEITLLQNELVSKAEIQRISQRLVANLVYSQDDISNRAKSIGNLAVNGLDFRLSEQLPQKLAAVTPQDIQRVAREYFIRDNLSILHLVPNKSAKQ
jgi:zinc protease